MKEHPDIVKFCRFPAYVRTHSTGILRGLPLSTRTLEQSLVCYTLSEVYRLPVRTYTAIAPNASYRVTTKFAQSELDSSKQKAGYHRHGDTLPLLIYRSVAAVNFNKQKSTRTLFRKESGSGTNCMVDGTGLEPVTSCTSSRCSTS